MPRRQTSSESGQVLIIFAFAFIAIIMTLALLFDGARGLVLSVAVAVAQFWPDYYSILTVLAMFNTLQGRQALFEQSHGALRDTLPEPMFRFLSAAGSDWETPVVGAAITRPAIPGPEVFDLRHVITEARLENNPPKGGCYKIIAVLNPSCA